MSVRVLLRWLTYILLSAAVLSSTYLYLYPLWFGCAFPSTNGSAYNGFRQTVARHAGHHPSLDDTSLAPFRLLVLADPQLEGDSSLPDPEDALPARLNAHATRLRQTPVGNLTNVTVEVVKELVLEDIPRSFQAARKTLDLFGNDYYLAHIYRTLHWWSFPTHITVLGDLIGSQWTSDDEFDWRGWRYWNRVFAGSQRVDDETMASHTVHKDAWQALYSLRPNGPHNWENTIINTVGNHDIGYAGDISRSRVDRFERTFGKVNWDIHLAYPYELIPPSYLNASQPIPTFHLIILNSMLLDTPAFDDSLQGETYNYINGLITDRLDPVEDRNSTFTLLLTHVPLHKPEGTCVDAPFFDFWDYTDADGAFKKGGLKEQNHLSEHASHSGILQSIFGMSGNHDAAAGGRGRNGLILTGHDHAGCDTVHYIERNPLYEAERKEDDNGEEAIFKFNDPNPPKPWFWKSVRTSSFPPPSASPPILDSNNQPGQNLSPDIVTSIREVTMRSMMGEFGGNAGLLSLWYDFDAQEWKYEIQMCPLGVQHVWWAVHVVDIVAVLVLFGWVGNWIIEMIGSMTSRSNVSSTKKEMATEDQKLKDSGVRNGDDRAADFGKSMRSSRVDEIRADAGAATRTGASGVNLRSASPRRRKG